MLPVDGMNGIVCPNCGSGRLYRSRRRHPVERALGVFGTHIRRCHDCNKRYARFGHSMINMHDVQRVSRRLGLAIAMAAAIILLMGTILWFNRAQFAHPSDSGTIRGGHYERVPAQVV